MKKQTLICLMCFLLVFAGLTHAQTTITSPPGLITFQRTYQVTTQEYLYGMEQTSDSGYILVGQLLNTAGPFVFDGYAQRVDKYGNTMWAKNYGGSGFAIERLSDVHQTSDGGFICSGTTSVGGGNQYLMKLDAMGNLTWVNSYGDFYGVLATEGDAHVVQTADGGYMFTASTDSSSSPDHSQLTLVKVDAGGIVQWQKIYQSFEDSTFQGGGMIIPTTDGNYMVSGVTSTSGSDPNILVMKVDPNGDSLWTRIYDINPLEGGARIAQATDGGYVLAGSITNTSYDTAAYLLKIDSVGTPLWSKAYAITGIQMAGYVMDAVSDGGIMLGGYEGPNASFAWNYWMIKTDATGDTLWTRRYAQSANNPGVAWDGEETSDGGFIIGGNGGSIGGPTNTDIMLVKTDNMGNSGCAEFPFPVRITPLPIVTTQQTYHIYSTNADSIPATLVTTQIVTDIVICCHVPLELTGNDTVCAGDSVTLYAAGAYSYLWSTGATTQSITVLANADTAISVTGFSGPSSSCDVLTLNIMAHIPNPSITGDTAICENTSTTLTASGGNSYLWSTGDTTASITVTLPADTTFYVMMMYGACAFNDTVDVTVHSSPEILTGGDDTICAGQSATLNATGALSYDWNTGDTTASIIVSPGTSTTYTVIGTNIFGCADTAIFPVTVNATPILNVAGNTTLCSGESTTLTASGGSTYQWSTGSQNTSITVSPAGPTTYSVITTSIDGCLDTAFVAVIVNPTPVAQIAGSSTLCSGSSVTLTASGGSTYAWSTGATTNSITVSPTSLTTYSVIVTTGSCADTATTSINVFTPPTATATAAQDSILIGTSTTLFATGGGTYTWSPSNGLSCTNCASPTADPTQTTTYCVMVTDSNGCTDNACIVIFVDNKCAQLFVPNAFSPNGDGENDKLCVYGTQCITEFRMAIYDRWGEKVFETTDANTCWDGMYKGALMDAAVFVYYLAGTDVKGMPVSKQGNITLVR